MTEKDRKAENPRRADEETTDLDREDVRELREAADKAREEIADKVAGKIRGRGSK